MKKENKKLRNKLISGMVTFLLIMSICLCLFIFVQVLNKGYVAIGGYSFFKVVTPSMEPTIEVGALILTKEADVSEVEIDDIISFFSKDPYMQGKIITHRVVGIDSSSNGKVRLNTRGDNNPSADVEYVDSSNMIGEVVWYSGEDNFFAAMLNFFSSRAGFFTCIALPAILISVFIFKRCIGNIMGDIKKMRAELDEANGGEETTEEKQECADPQNVCDGAGTEKGAISDEEYERIRERIRAELTEELRSGNDREQ